jgi:hypothetical protein
MRRLFSGCGGLFPVFLLPANMCPGVKRTEADEISTGILCPAKDLDVWPQYAYPLFRAETGLHARSPRGKD